MNVNIIQLEQNMKNAVVHLMSIFAAMRGSRVTCHSLDNIHVHAHGGRVLLKHIGSVSVLDSHSLTITLFDKTLGSAVKQAILDQMNLNAQGTDTLIIKVPPMTQEVSKQLVKEAHKHAEEARIVLRNLRLGALNELKTIKKEQTLSEDEEKRIRNEIDQKHKLYDEQIHLLSEWKEHHITDTTYKNESKANQLISDISKYQPKQN